MDGGKPALIPVSDLGAARETASTAETNPVKDKLTHSRLDGWVSRPRGRDRSTLLYRLGSALRGFSPNPTGIACLAILVQLVSQRSSSDAQRRCRQRAIAAGLL